MTGSYGTLGILASDTGGKATLDQATARQEAAATGTFQNVLALKSAPPAFFPSQSMCLARATRVASYVP